MHDTNFAIYLFPLIVPLFLLCAFVRVLYVFFFRAETFPGQSFPLFFFSFPYPFIFALFICYRLEL